MSFYKRRIRESRFPHQKDLRIPATEEAPVLKALPKLSQEDRQIMIQARVAKKWSQSDLAKQANLQVGCSSVGYANSASKAGLSHGTRRGD